MLLLDQMQPGQHVRFASGNFEREGVVKQLQGDTYALVLWSDGTESWWNTVTLLPASKSQPPPRTEDTIRHELEQAMAELVEDVEEFLDWNTAAPLREHVEKIRALQTELREAAG